MNRVQEVYDVTLKMNEILSETVSTHNRDTVIEQIQKLLQQRETLLLELKKPFTKEETLLGQKLVDINKEVQEKMDQHFTALKLEMKQIKKQKHSNKNYVNPYRNVAVMDGMYLDKKK